MRDLEMDDDFDFGSFSVYVAANYNKVQYVLDIIEDCNKKIDLLKLNEKSFEEFNSDRRIDEKIIVPLSYEHQCKLSMTDRLKHHLSLSHSEKINVCLLNYYSNIRQKSLVKLKS